MCRLFGLSAGGQRVRATFWLLDAVDSLSQQSRANPDGTGLGTFDEAGRPVVEKQPLAAYADADFATEAKERISSTFVAHVRHSSGTALAARNTHPFEQSGRLFAHNGVVQGLDRLDAHLGDDMELVHGDTDSERVFALITRETRAAGGDVETGIRTAMRWVADQLPVFAVNAVLTTAEDLWAWRYPQTHELWLLDRQSTSQPLEYRSTEGARVASTQLADAPSVIVASEPLDHDPRWRLIEPDVLIHVGTGCRITRSPLVGHAPRHPLTLSDLGIVAARSQHPASPSG